MDLHNYVRAARRAFLRTAIVGSAVALFARAPTFAQNAGSGVGAVAKPAGWDQLIEAARTEGTVVVYGPPGTVYRRPLVDAFEKAFPGITVAGTFGDSSDRTSRILAERTAGRYSVDVIVDGTANPVTVLKQAGALSPLKPILVLPEVTDTSNWAENQLWWADATEPYTTLIYLGVVTQVASYNKTLVNPKEFTSYRDFLDPKWKGKIVATDVRKPGPGAAPARWIYKHPQLGPEYLKQLFGQMDMVLSNDQRQMVDWLAQGRYPLGLFINSTDVRQAAAQGLPVGVIEGEASKEGALISAGWGAVALVDRAPHPNAAKLFINWLLSREGQDTWQKETKEPSLRTDLPKDDVFDAMKPGFKYVNASSEEYARITGVVIQPLITEALSTAGRQ